MAKPISQPKAPSFRQATPDELSHLPYLDGRPSLQDYYGKVLVQIVTNGTLRERKPMFVSFSPDEQPIDQAWADQIALSAWHNNGTVIHEVICYGIVEEMGTHAKAN